MPTTHSNAQARALKLLKAGDEAKPTHGFLDLLGDEEQAGPPTGLAQRLMRTSIVPSIYEQYWRPALGRVAKGLRGPTMAGEVAIATNLLGLRPGLTALDVACGTGRFTRAFGKAVGPDGLAIGLDGSRTMLDRALDNASPADPVAYLRADAVDLPLRPATVDAVCCFAALHMFADPDAALASFARVLKPGGRVALLTSARRTWQPARLADTALGAASGQKMFDRGEIAGKLRDLGFKSVSERFAGVTQIVAGTR
ncbi:Ubiquinone/menaquinone biosynthesis C-methylase UbiE [Amycolatopsis xylanica]|uniref:Ubiquinone/menaquinone biosynthesis C-methylase UbiE n=1 Tax=Amycolatopsis xylanica TaxID=589385 RepID=A0A1H3D0V4_9PSEU|nr:methyltransferase domain-containing protein [Amycolatopsis xylanica]SDX60005.1 Ubiquinone/menaquinone biosynthesis C-methylase UbiE [Amycolatopsis xylanica]